MTENDVVAQPDVPNLMNPAFYLRDHDQQIEAIAQMTGTYRVPPRDVSERILTYCQSIALRAGLFRLEGMKPILVLRNGAKPEEPGGSVRIGYRHEDEITRRAIEEFFNIGTSDGRFQGYYTQSDGTQHGETKTSIREFDFKAATDRSPAESTFDTRQCSLDFITFHDQRVTETQIHNGSVPRGVITYPEESLKDHYCLEQHAILAVHIAELAHLHGIDVKLTHVDIHNAHYDVLGQPVSLNFGNPSTIEFIVGMKDFEEPEYADELGLNRDTIISQTYRSPMSNEFGTYTQEAIDHMLHLMDDIARHQQAMPARTPPAEAHLLR